MEGLEDSQLASCLRTFPAVFQPLFVNHGRCEAQDVVNILKHKPQMTTAEQVVFDFLIRFLTECNPTGINKIVFFSYRGEGNKSMC